MHLQNINSWVAIADACSKCKSLQKLFLKDLQYREGGHRMTSLAKPKLEL